MSTSFASLNDAFFILSIISWKIGCSSASNHVISLMIEMHADDIEVKWSCSPISFLFRFHKEKLRTTKCGYCCCNPRCSVFSGDMKSSVTTPFERETSSPTWMMSKPMIFASKMYIFRSRWIIPMLCKLAFCGDSFLRIDPNSSANARMLNLKKDFDFLHWVLKSFEFVMIVFHFDYFLTQILRKMLIINFVANRGYFFSDHLHRFSLNFIFSSSFFGPLFLFAFIEPHYFSISFFLCQSMVMWLQNWFDFWTTFNKFEQFNWIY